jgi:hypothetical protein
MSSWGHAVRPLTADERAYIFSQDEVKPMPPWWGSGEAAWKEHEEGWSRRRRRCSVRCQNDVAYVTTYQYITGRAMRTSWADRRVCAEHAAKFAAKHGLELPPVDADPGEVPEHASALVTRAFLEAEAQ